MYGDFLLAIHPIHLPYRRKPPPSYSNCHAEGTNKHTKHGIIS